MTQIITIDGSALPFEPGQTILDVASANGIAIPTLCYLPETGHRDVCRICMVEVEGAGRLLPACSTPATDGMVVATASTRVVESRRRTIELLIGSGQHTCITCEALGRCALSGLAYEYGVEPPETITKEEFPLVEDAYVVRDYSKCILCGRCWAACTAIQVHGVVPHPSGRRAERAGGRDWYPLPDLEQCELCGQCIDACPVGALTERRAKGAAREWELERVRTTCPHCGLGCQTVVHLKDGKIVKVTGAGDALPNRGRLCRRGRFAVYEADERERLTAPLIREGEALREATWDEAMETVVARLGAIRDEHGAGAVAGLVSPSHTNEDAYQAQKFFRAVIGTNNVDHRSPDASRLPLEMQGEAPACYAAGALAVLEQAQVILVVGDGDIDDYAVAGAGVRRAVREGARLLVIDAGHNTLGELAATRLTVEPDAVPGVLNGIMSVLLAGELTGRSELGEAVPHLPHLESLLAAYLPERVADASGAEAALIRSIATDLTTIKPAVVMSALGAGDDVAGTWAAVTRLQGLLNDIAGALRLTLPRGGGNAQGLLDMGVVPGLLPGHLEVTDVAARRRVAEVWGVAGLPAVPGLGTAELLESLKDGGARAVWVCADDTGDFGAETGLLERLRRAELVIAQSAVAGDLAGVAHVVLPTLTWGEDDGTFVNAERRVSRVRRVRRPPAEARPGWWIFREAARRFGHDWTAPYPKAIWAAEIARLAPGLEGITYADLEQWGLCWHPVTGVPDASGIISG